MWRFQTGAAVTAQAVADGKGRVYVGSHDHFLYALDARTGALIWKRDLLDRIYSTPFIDNEGNVYVGSDADAVWSFSRGGDLRFKLPTNLERRGDFDADTAIVSSPKNGILHFAAGPYLFAMTADGAVLWSVRARAKLFSNPAVDSDGNVYIGCQDDSLYSVDFEGRVRWTYGTRGDVDSSPAIGQDGTVFVGSDDRHLHAIDSEGVSRWKHDVGAPIRGAPAISRDGLVIVGTLGPDPKLIALDAKDGSVVWEFTVSPTNSIELGILSSPVIARDGTILFGSHDDFLYALSRAGDLRWRARAPSDVDSVVGLISDGMAVFGADDGSVIALH